jgi:hypothetical protein
VGCSSGKAVMMMVTAVARLEKASGGAFVRGVVESIGGEDYPSICTWCVI